MSQEIQQELIDYMFLRDDTGKIDAFACLELWFGKSHGTDNEIRSRYGNLVERAIDGQLDTWMEKAQGFLALMILVDQFPLFLKAIHLLETKDVIEPQPDKNVCEQAITALREAFFQDLRDISDRKVQWSIAEALELPVSQIQQEIDSGAAYGELSIDFQEVKDYNVTVSPTMIFNEGTQRLNGNVGYRVMEANIRELLYSVSGEESWC